MIKKLESELKEAKDKLKQTSMKKEALEKAIWDMINYANIFVLLLDSKMNVLLINQSFSKTLGFDDPKEVIDKCWLDFIKPEDKEFINIVHHSLAFDNEKVSKKYMEVVNDVVKTDGESLSIRWFNFPINHQYNLIFSFGLPTEIPAEITEESIRTYYQEILLKDKTMILSLKDMAIKDLQTLDNCERELTKLDGPFDT